MYVEGTKENNGIDQYGFSKNVNVFQFEWEVEIVFDSILCEAIHGISKPSIRPHFLLKIQMNASLKKQTNNETGIRLNGIDFSSCDFPISDAEKIKQENFFRAVFNI